MVKFLLIKAEVENELGNLPAATSAINQIRNRAGLPNTTASNKDDLQECYI